MKKCYKCKRTLSEDNFYKDKSLSDGLKGSCKTCNTDICRSYRMRHRKECREYRKKWATNHKEKVLEYSRRTRQKNFASVLIRGAKHRAQIKKVPFDLDEHTEEIRRRLDSWTCELTGIPLDKTKRRDFNSPSLDRIIPSVGYLYSNIRIVSYAVNCALGTWGEEKLRIIAEALLGRR